VKARKGRNIWDKEYLKEDNRSLRSINPTQEKKAEGKIKKPEKTHLQGGIGL